MSHDRQLRATVAVLVVGVAVASVVVGAVTLTMDTGSGPPENLGEVDGVSYNDSLALTVEDGFNESELDALVARSMARIEVIRGLEFEEQVPVEIISREEYRERRSGRSSETARTWENLRWETLFVVGEDRDATAIIEEAFRGGVQGYYSLSDERVVLVSDADQPTVDTETLVHELVHALQDQRFGIDYNTPTTDASQAYESLIEGEAELVPELYFDRCDGAWSCVRLDDETNGTDLDVGIQLGILLPYVQGQEFVDAVRERGDWGAVNDLHERPPESSTQVIHPDSYPERSPANVTVTDRSSAAWERIGPNEMERRLGVGEDKRGTDTLGEAAIYAMLVHNNAVDPENPMAYEHSFSAGWAGDQLVPYERDGELSYVWETAWETPNDAEQFAAAYRQVLEERGAVGTGADTYVIPDGSFEGAFRLAQQETTVRIVNAPTTDALDEVHA